MSSRVKACRSVICVASSGDTLKRTREALYRAADDDRNRGRNKHMMGDFDPTNQRVWNLLSRDNAFVDLAEHLRRGFLAHALQAFERLGREAVDVRIARDQALLA